jgi:hypothetical protein
MAALVTTDTSIMPTRITFGPPLPAGADTAGARVGRMIQLDNGDYILVEEDVPVVAARLNSDERLVELTRMWGRKRDKVYVNPLHVRHLTAYEAPVTETALISTADEYDHAVAATGAAPSPSN